MGEGLGRALGAGPMIFECLKRLGEEPTSQMIVERYEFLWKRHYTARLILGRWSRSLLERPTLLKPALEILCHQRWLINLMTPRIQEGFTVPSLECN
jgi:hypothetical protein